jgi:16S rRNA (adenine1518-N6/adenine1519-N6)-dimethyltransferase
VVNKPRRGQVFLADNEVLRRIADAAGLTPDATVLEIGMGRGALTQHLVRRAREVIAVELEGAFVSAAARDFAAFDNLTIVEGDILELDWDEVLPAGRRVAVVGNIPFYITGRILEMLKAQRARITGWSLTMQREVAARICAAPGGKAYGALSVKMQTRGEPYLAFTVPAAAFEPAPAVDAALVRYRYYDDRTAGTPAPALFDAFVDFIFRGRRKKLVNRLADTLGAAGPGAAALAAALRDAGLEPEARPERFSPAEFLRLFAIVEPYL